MAENALNSAKAKGIPIIIADQYPPAGEHGEHRRGDLRARRGRPAESDRLVDHRRLRRRGQRDHRRGSGLAVVEAVRHQLAVDLQASTAPAARSPSSTITASTNALLASATSANILANPNATYYYTEFEDSLQPTIQGIQQSARTGISLSVAGGSTDGLGLLKSGSSIVKAVVTVDEAYAAWALTDEILRMATKSAPVAETYVSRLFTTQNIGTIQVTPAAENSGAWFGDTSYQSEFAQLWGV